MKLHKVLTIANKVYQLASDDTRLDFKNPGRASFSFVGNESVSGLVSLDMGYNDNKLKRVFTGYVERCNIANNNLVVVFCRELSYQLKAQLPLNLRHCTMTEVIKAISKATGLKFVLPEADYTQSQAPYFYNLASGFYALDTLGDVFDIPNYFWQQAPTGEIYAGSYEQSFWGLKDAFTLDAKLLKDYKSSGIATLTPLPGLYPGAKINEGVITSLQIINDDMVIKWTKR